MGWFMAVLSPHLVEVVWIDDEVDGGCLKIWRFGCLEIWLFIHNEHLIINHEEKNLLIYSFIHSSNFVRKLGALCLLVLNLPHSFLPSLAIYNLSALLCNLRPVVASSKQVYNPPPPQRNAAATGEKANRTTVYLPAKSKKHT